MYGKKIAVCFLFLSFQMSCMLVIKKPKNAHKLSINGFKRIPSDIMRLIIGNLDHKSRIQLIETCTYFHKTYVDKDVLFSFLSSSDYTEAMVQYARKNNQEKIQLLMHHEGQDNKTCREKILSLCCPDSIHNLQAIIDMYKKEVSCEDGDENMGILVKNPALLQLRLKQGLSPNSKHQKGASFLNLAIVANAIESVIILLEDPRTDLNAQDKKGFTALRCAVLVGCNNILKILLGDCRTDPNVQCKNGFTVLMDATYSNNLEALKILLEDHRTDPNIQYGKGLTVIMYAFYTKNIEMLRVLLENERTDPNMRYGKGLTVLMSAVLSEQVEIVKILLASHKVDPNIMINYTGQTAYHFAKDPEIACLLSERTSFYKKYLPVALVGVGGVVNGLILLSWYCYGG